jgi:hypothetical protein
LGSHYDEEFNTERAEDTEWRRRVRLRPMAG